MKSLNLVHFENSKILSLGTVLSKTTALTSLNVPNRNIDLIENICHLTRLEEVIIKTTNVTDKTITLLSSHSNLKRLTISYCIGFSGKELKRLSTLIKMTSLNISGNQLFSGLEYLPPSLNELNLTDH